MKDEGALDIDGRSFALVFVAVARFMLAARSGIHQPHERSTVAAKSVSETFSGLEDYSLRNDPHARPTLECEARHVQAVAGTFTCIPSPQ
jgi:hypothetical protein